MKTCGCDDGECCELCCEYYDECGGEECILDEDYDRLVDDWFYGDWEDGLDTREFDEDVDLVITQEDVVHDGNRLATIFIVLGIIVFVGLAVKIVFF